MTERIITAMNYHLDSFTKAFPKQYKQQRMLGDIEGKYSITDPLLEVPYQTYNNTRMSDESPEKKPIYQPLAGTVFRGIEEDLERLIRSPERARSSTAPVKSARVALSRRPATSSSQVNGRSSAGRQYRNLPKSRSKYAPHASVKRLAFTSPSIKIGAVDVRDEVTDEIVNKPMTLRWGNLKTQSAPPGGRVRPGVLRSSSAATIAKCTSSSSNRRVRTSYSRRRRIRAKSHDKIPGPFVTVKVSNKDLWVVSNSTPTTFFTDIASNGLHEENGTTNSVKFTSWENTADSVPKAEQSSPPRYERLLGPPAQLSPTIKWLRYDHNAPPKKPPILTPFKGTLDGRYYHLESQQCKRVNRHINASPGVRIARNGEVLSHSMKLESLDDGDDRSEQGSESESEADISSLIPVKLAAKIKKRYGTPENDSASEYEELESNVTETDVEEDDVIETPNHDEINAEVKDSANPNINVEMDVSENTTRSEAGQDQVKDVNNHSDNYSEESSMSDDDSEESFDQEKTLLTKESVQLLDRITGHNHSNPFVDSSEQTSTNSYDSHELEGFINNLDTKILKDVDEDSDVWRVLENVNPTFWISHSRHKKLAILRKLRKQGESEPLVGSMQESIGSAKTRLDTSEEVILPLCWEDELINADKIVKGREGKPNTIQKRDATALPVVYHQGHRNFLPAATVTSSLKHSVVLEKSKSARSSHSVNFSINSTRGYKVPVSTPRSNRSDRAASVGNSRQTSASSSRGRNIMDLADLLQVTPDSLPPKTSTTMASGHSVAKDHVTLVHENGNGRSSEFAIEQNHDDGNSAARRDVKPGHEPSGIASDRLREPIETLDFTRLDVESTSESNNFLSSQRYSDLKSSELASPQNTPTTPYRQSNGFIQRNPATGQLSDSKRPGERDGNSAESHYQKAPLGSKPMSVFSYDENKGRSGNKLQVKSPNRGPINTIDHSEHRPKGSRFSPLHHGSVGSKAMKLPSNKNNVSLSNDILENGLIVPTTQLRPPNSPNTFPMKTADFIQITQSLHIRDRPVTEFERSPPTGNKMYDSYMHELAAQSPDTRDDHVDDRGIVGRSLGGNSGKGVILPLPRSVKKNLASCQTNQSPQSPNISPFTPQAGRRSGLTMVPQDGSRHVGPFGLGVKGDQVRLNIDKNIHNIYRDLGVSKSPGRSHVTSAKSQSSQKDDITVTIPSVPPSERDAEVESPTGGEMKEFNNDSTSEAKPTTRPSSSNPSVVVQDSGTQWSSRSVKIDDESNGIPPISGEKIDNGDGFPTMHDNEESSRKNYSVDKMDIDPSLSKTEEKQTVVISETTQEKADTSNMHVVEGEAEPMAVPGELKEASDEELSEFGDVRGVTKVTVNMQPE